MDKTTIVTDVVETGVCTKGLSIISRLGTCGTIGVATVAATAIGVGTFFVIRGIKKLIKTKKVMSNTATETSQEDIDQNANGVNSNN